MAERPHTGGGNTKGRRTSFGSTRKLPSGRWQARFTGPDGRVHKAPTTFQTKGDAHTWLTLQRADITREQWLPSSSRKTSPTFEAVSNEWLAMPRPRPLKPRTTAHYASLLERFILPRFGDVKVGAITAVDVEVWYADLPADRPTYRAHAYSLARTIMGYAVTKKYATANPCTLTGAGTVRRRRSIEPASLAELEVIANHMPDRYRAMTLLAAWTALRFGELTELRRRDIDLGKGIVSVTRAVVHVNGRAIVGDPKSAAGIRDIAIPPHLTPFLQNHLDSLPGGRDVLLFPAADGVSHMQQSSLARVWYPARQAADRPDLRWHDLRHSGATMAAQAGATLAELMGRLGHSTPQAALIYQHRARGRDAEIAAALSRMAGHDSP